MLQRLTVYTLADAAGMNSEIENEITTRRGTDEQGSGTFYWLIEAELCVLNEFMHIHVYKDELMIERKSHFTFQ